MTRWNYPSAQRFQQRGWKKWATGFEVGARCAGCLRVGGLVWLRRKFDARRRYDQHAHSDGSASARQFQFQATVTGAATTTVTWQICLPPTPTNVQPTTCSPAAVGQTQLPSGYGTITTGQNNTGGGLYTAPQRRACNESVPGGGHQYDQHDGIRHRDGDAAIRRRGTHHSEHRDDCCGRSFPIHRECDRHDEYECHLGSGRSSGRYRGGWLHLSQLADHGAVHCRRIFRAGEYAAGAETITAVSAFDPSVQGTATVTIASSDAPTLTSLTPNTVGEGSRQQDVYLDGTNFNSNDVVMVGNPPVAVPTIFITASSLRATIPAGPLSVAGLVRLVVQAQNGDVSASLSGPQGLTVVPSRPAVVAVTPDTLVSGGTSLGVNVVGGYFSSQTTVQCNGASAPATLTSGQQLTRDGTGLVHTFAGPLSDRRAE